MPVRQLHLSFAAVAVCALAAGVSGAGRGPERRDAALLKAKVAAINAFAERPSDQSRRTTVTETEVNAYLLYDVGTNLPVGVVEPTVAILGAGRLSGRAVVDLDAVRKERKPTSLLDPMNYLGGRLPITATGVLTTSDGVGHFSLESTAVSGIPVPKIVLQEIVSYYSRRPDLPAGINLDSPFTLPARIREILVERGQAIVVQ